MEENKQCPYCGETIKAAAKKCRHCGEWLDSVPASDTTPVSQEADPHFGKETIAETDYSIYSIACTVMIFLAILSGYKELPIHGSGWFATATAWIPKWLLTLCSGILDVYIIYGLGKLCREKGLKNEWIFPCYIGLSVISWLFAVWDPSDIDFEHSVLLLLLLIILIPGTAIVQTAIGVIVINKASLPAGIMLIVACVADLFYSFYDGEDLFWSLGCILINCVVTMGLYKVLRDVFNTASENAAPAEEE